MGVSIQVIGLVGIKLISTEIENINDIDDFTEDIEQEGLDTVFDGMSSEYLYIGRKLFESTNSRYDAMEISAKLFPEEIVEIANKVQKEIKDYIFKRDIALHVFTHFE